MSMGAALKAARAVELVRRVLAIELLCACQAIDLLAPLTTSAALAGVHRLVREHVAPLDDDRPPAPDVERLARLVDEGRVEQACGLMLA
jgi:histidine ammonia-lyase